MSTRRIVLIVLGILILIVGGYILYIMMTTRSHSPADVAEYHGNGLDIRIEYCRPYKKGRLIFGEASEEALQPYGKYWRLGANEATKLTVGTPVTFGNQKLEAGSYALYAFPNQDHWVIGINSEADRWGARPPDFDKDVGRIKVPVNLQSDAREQFTITIESDPAGATIKMGWDQHQVEVPVKVIQ